MSGGLIAAIAAVMVDSVVTLYVGWRLNHTAREEIAKGVQDVLEHAPEILAKTMEKGSSNE